MQLTKEKALEMFEYADGKLIRKQNSSTAKAGDVAGSKESNGYLRVRIDNHKYLIHQVIFLMHYGYLPKTIDHINRIKDDNRIENLREATVKQNSYNSALEVKSKSGIKNVQWIKHMDKWQVRMRLDKSNKVIGYFKDKELAELVAIEARSKYHGQFANNGVIL